MCIIKRDDNVKNKEEGLYCLLLVLCKECIISSQKGSIISCTCRSLHLLNQLKLAQYVYHSLYAQLTKKDNSRRGCFQLTNPGVFATFVTSCSHTHF